MPRKPKAPPLPVVDATRALASFLQKAGRSLAPQPIPLLEIISSQWRYHALGVVARLRIADKLANGPRDVAELAREADVHEDSLFRVLRALASDGLFVRIHPRHFGLNAVVEPLRSDHPRSLLHTVLQITSPWSQQTWQELGATVKDGQPSFERIFGKQLWDYFEDHPDDGRDFHESMMELSRLDIDPIAAAYDFSAHQRVVDIGGGTGQLLAGLLLAWPELRGAVCDTEQGAAGAKAQFAQAGVSDRAEIIFGNFHESIPGGFDLYIMRQIAHGHRDEDMKPILVRVRSAMESGARLLILDTLVPENTPGSHPAFLDLQMLVGSGGRERTRCEMEELLLSAGFHLKDVIRTASLTAVFVAEPRS